MKVAFYRSRDDGRIMNYQKIPEDWDSETIKRKVDEFNEYPKNGNSMAEAIDVESDGFIAYLIGRVQQKENYSKSVVNDIADSLRDALCLVENLSVVDTAEAERIEKIRDKYAASARISALYLDRFCNESLPYDEMVSDASRKACEKIERLESIVKNAITAYEFELEKQDYETEEELHKVLLTEFNMTEEEYKQLIENQ